MTKKCERNSENVLNPESQRRRLNFYCPTPSSNQKFRIAGEGKVNKFLEFGEQTEKKISTKLRKVHNPEL